MSFGFLGIQMGFAMQNANASRILQTFGADVEHLSLFWLVATITGMPGLVQFFSWFALFSMWVFTTPALAQHVWGLPSTDNSTLEFNEAGNYVGVIFGVYNLVSAVFAFMLPVIAAKIGRKGTHAACLIAGGVSLMSVYLITDPSMK